jgi:hypothetical protein
MCTGATAFDAQGAASATFVRCSFAALKPWASPGARSPPPAPTPRRTIEFRPGVAIEELLGVKKLSYNGVQQGIVSCFFCAAVRLLSLNPNK